MANIIGEVKVFKATEKEYDGRKYYSCMGMTKDNDLYKFSAREEDHPVNGDIFRMEISPSDRDLRPYVRFVKVK